ncbi:hypothetical protein, partial [Streptomyces sp. SID5770]|uniref:hypothetical protein n=1 Tax=Streptomyces sp. SID5770 TaxID=2690308 RepID=UPI001F4548EC
ITSGADGSSSFGSCRLRLAAHIDAHGRGDIRRSFVHDSMQPPAAERQSLRRSFTGIDAQG